MDFSVIEKALRGASIDGVTEFLLKLESNWANEGHRLDFIAEAETALMFSGRGFDVTMRDRPDLGLVICDGKVNAEVKRFKFKEQDCLDGAALDAAGNALVQYGDPCESEGKASWVQIFEVACHKAHSLPEDAANLIVIRSASPHCIEDVDIRTARNEIDERLKMEPKCALKRVSGLMLMWQYSQTDGRNVFYFPVTRADVRPSREVDAAIGAITRWSTLES